MSAGSEISAVAVGELLLCLARYLEHMSNAGVVGTYLHIVVSSILITGGAASASHLISCQLVVLR